MNIEKEEGNNTVILEENEPKSKKRSAKTLKKEIKEVAFWDSIQNLNNNKITKEHQYQTELQVLRADIGYNVVNDYIFGVHNDMIDIFLERKSDIDNKYEGKRLDTCIADNGEYVYTDRDLDNISFIKNNVL